MKNNIFLTGAPSSGKTTVVVKVVKQLLLPARGFITHEERFGERRVGFLMKTLDGCEGYLAHQDITSDFRIRRFGVSIENIERIAVPAIVPADDHIIILDEIGKMECFSDAFRNAVLAALDSVNILLGTIALGGDIFIKGIKERDDVEIVEVTQDNRDDLPGFLLDKIAQLKHEDFFQ